MDNNGTVRPPDEFPPPPPPWQQPPPPWPQPQPQWPQPPQQPWPGYYPPPPPQPKGGSARTGPLPLHPMTVSDILDGAFKLLRANLRTIAIVAAVFVVPVQLIAAIVQRGVGVSNIVRVFNDPTAVQSSNEPDSTLLVATLIVTVIGLLSAPFVAGAISRIVSASYAGGEEAPQDALRATFRRSWALLASFVLVHLLELVGFVLCVLPGLAVMTMFVMVAPAIVIEGLGPIQGMRRSWRLAKGRFWATLGIALLAGMLSGLVSNALSVPFLIIGIPFGDFAWIPTAIGGILAALVARPIVAVVATLQYYDGRIRTEGYDLQVIAANLARG